MDAPANFIAHALKFASARAAPAAYLGPGPGVRVGEGHPAAGEAAGPDKM